MATKQDPGNYDCYTKAAPDEPIFTLRGKDPAGPHLVKIWAASRAGDWGLVMELTRRMIADPAVQARVSTDDYDKLREARGVADEMTRWRLRKEARDAGGRQDTAGPADARG